MISRRDALKLSATGLILPAVLQGCNTGAQNKEQTSTNLQGNTTRTGVMPGPGPLADKPIEVKWHLPEYRSNKSPVVAEGVIYFGSSLDGNAYALSAESGVELWRTWLNESIWSAPAILDGIVYIGSSNGLHALDISNGLEIWRISNPHNIYHFTSPVVANNAVYAQDGAGNLYAVDAKSGLERWKFHGSGNTLSSPAYSNGMIYFSSRAWSTIHAFDAESGQERWRTKYERQGDAFVCVESDVLYASTEGGYVYCINAKTGAELWQFRHSGDSNRSAPAVSNGIVYVGSLDGNLYALDAQTGNELWRFLAGVEIQSSPVISEKVVYIVGLDGHLHAIDALDGSEYWSFITESTMISLTSSPFVTDGIVYVGQHGFYALGSQ